MADQDDSTKQTDFLFDKPPSPVLSHTTTRKFLLSRKLQRKSRVKLTDRFSEGSSQLANTSDDVGTSQADETSKSASSHITEKIEAEDQKFEENNQNKSRVVEGFQFRKPESPACSKKLRAQPVARRDTSQFKTAGGSSIHLKEDVVKKSKRLFDDILIPNSQICENKYAFLSKRKIDGFVQKNSNEEEKIISRNTASTSENTNMVDRFSVKEKSLGKSGRFGFKTASDKGVQIKESAYKTACKKFSEEFDNCKLLKNSETTNMDNDDEICLLNTQETNELFSDFTIMEEKLCNDKMFVKNEEQCSFKGFEAEIINQSRRNVAEFKRVILQLDGAVKLCSKSNKPSRLRSKSTRNVILPCRQLQVREEIRNKSSTGFSMASGKQIQITESALNLAQFTFRKELLEDSENSHIQQVVSKTCWSKTLEKENSRKASVGFSKASGKKIEIPESALNMAQRKFRQELENSENSQRQQEVDSKTYSSFRARPTEDSRKASVGFSKASGKKIEIPESALNMAQRKFRQELENSEKSQRQQEVDSQSYSSFRARATEDSRNASVGFSKASGKKIEITESALNMAQRKFRQELENSENSQRQQEVDSKTYSSFRARPTEDSRKASVGFSKASGKKIEIPESALNMAQRKFRQELENSENSQGQQEVDSQTYSSFRTGATEDSRKASVGFSKASGKKIEITESALNMAQRKFRQELENSEKSQGQQEVDSCKTSSTFRPSVGFSKASGKQIKTTESALNIARTRFQQEFSSHGSGFPEDAFNLSLIKNESNMKGEQSFSCASLLELDFKGFDDKTIEESRIKADYFATLIQDFNSNDKTLLANSTSRLPLHELMNETLKPSTFGSSTGLGHKLIVSIEALDKAKIKRKAESTPLRKKFKCNELGDENVRPCSLFQTATGKSLRMSGDALNNAKHLFDDVNNDLSFDNSSKSIIQEEVSFENNSLSRNSALNNSATIYRKKRLGMSGCKQIPISKDKIEQAKRLLEIEKLAIMSPIRQSVPNVYNSTPLRNSSFVGLNTDITPIKHSHTVVQESVREDVIDDRFLIQECTKGSIDSWSKNLENEKRALEIKLKVIEDKQKALFFQNCCMENKSQDQRKKRNGILFDKKQTGDRVSLAQLLKVDASLRNKLNINPQNAEFVHFKCSQQNVALVATGDGAHIIPNINHYVGLSEIEIAFQVMLGVDPKLIPQGWIRNHFKWIVWKLASYENFLSDLNGCMTIENVVQQLKYRYDREIDRAERSTIRKIYEMDDAPQKRMVLCVSNIFDLQNEQFELELTDGWYSIRTVIDKALCRQVIRRKIQIGTKIITCGAELINCEGCHPLQATDMIRLKITCNSTRRTRWYTKLGYQNCSEPFPVKVCSVYPNGGLIGCIKIYIARVYPVKYMEKQNRLTVWRNRKAEELRAQDWENKERQNMEKFRETITKDYEMNICNARQNQSINMRDAEIKKITCPETLFTLCQNHNDPERLQEILTSSQKVSVMDYQQRLLLRQQQEISSKLKSTIGKQQIVKRDVTPVLQVLVIDVLDPNQNGYVFQIWRPSDMHLEIITESSVLNAYSVLLKDNGNLSTMSRTKFQTQQIDSSQFNKYKRTLFPISQLSDLVNKPIFNKFDTVGIVITMSTNDFTQNIWLSDPSGRLLFVKIFESPKNCLLLDKLKVGQLVAASNLIFSEPKLDFGEAIADHLTVFASYPQAKHLQEGIATLSEQLPKDMKLFLEECNQRISYYVDKIDITKDRKKSSTSLMQSNSSITSDIFDESSDVLFSMIDVDKFT